MSMFLTLIGIWFFLPLVLLTVALLVHRKRNPLPEMTAHQMVYHKDIYGTEMAQAKCACGATAYGLKELVAGFVENHRKMEVPVGN